MIDIPIRLSDLNGLQSLKKKKKKNIPSQIAYNQSTEFHPAGSPVAQFCAGSGVFL